MSKVFQKIPGSEVDLFKIKLVEFKVFAHLFDDRGVDVARVGAARAYLERADRQYPRAGADVGGGDAGADVFFQQFEHDLRAFVISGAKGAAGIDIERRSVRGLRAFVPRREHDEAAPHGKRREGLFRRHVPRLVVYLSPVLDLNSGELLHRLKEPPLPERYLLVAPVIHAQTRVTVGKLLQLRADALRDIRE